MSMKKIIILLMIACLVLLSGCNNEKAPVASPSKSNQSGNHAVIPDKMENEEGIIEIREKMFIAQTNDIYLNPEDYLGKTIKYEGIFDMYEYEETGTTYYYVIRYGPGCCGYDANAGFEVVWSGDYPKQNDWVEVVGVLEEYEEDENLYLRLNLSSLTVLDVRGEEYVSQ